MYALCKNSSTLKHLKPTPCTADSNKSRNLSSLSSFVFPSYMLSIKRIIQRRKLYIKMTTLLFSDCVYFSRESFIIDYCECYLRDFVIRRFSWRGFTNFIFDYFQFYRYKSKQSHNNFNFQNV